MKTRDEIYILQDLADLAKTLLDTGDGEARDAARPIVALIKAQFVGSTEAASKAEETCNQAEAAGPNPHYDPVAAATERLRLAVMESDEAKAKFDAFNEGKEKAANVVNVTFRAREEAQRELVKAIEAASRA